MAIRMSAVGIVLLCAVLALVGCEEYANYTPNAEELTAIAVHYEGEDKIEIQGTAVARYMTAEAAQAVSEQAAADIARLEATQQAAQNAERQQYLAMTADAQATRDRLSADGTRQAVDALATQQAYSFQATATAEVFRVTAQAAAIEATRAADERYWSATLTAEGRNREATATQQARNDVATATQQSIDATRGAVHATMTRQAERREVVLGYGRDYGIPLAMMALGLGVAVVIGFLWMEQRKKPVVYRRNLLGDAEPMAFPKQGGGFTVVDLDRQPGPVIQVSPDGTVEAPELRDRGQEERTTARDQEVDAATRPKIGGGGGRGARWGLPAPPVAPGLRMIGSFRRLDQVKLAGMMSPPLVDSLEADWEECDEGR